MGVGAAIEEGIKRVSLELQTMTPESRDPGGVSTERSDDADDAVSVPVMGSVTNEDDANDVMSVKDPKDDVKDARRAPI